MDPTVISSLITAAVTLVICLITNYAQSKKTLALLEYRLDALTRQVEKHNNVVERMTAVEIHDRENRKDLDELFNQFRDFKKEVRGK